MKTHKKTGIILHTYPLFEKDICVEVLTTKYGKLKCLAKYAKTSKFKFGGKLDIGNQVEIVLYKGKTFDILTQCDVINNIQNCRNHFNTLSISLYCIDLIRKVTQFNQPAESLFHLLKDTLNTLEASPETAANIKAEFQHQLLCLEGIYTSTTTQPSDRVFKQIFEDYSGIRIKEPLLLQTLT